MSVRQVAYFWKPFWLAPGSMRPTDAAEEVEDGLCCWLFFTFFSSALERPRTGSGPGTPIGVPLSLFGKRRGNLYLDGGRNMQDLGYDLPRSHLSTSFDEWRKMHQS
jgi:hypothetical protein